MNVRKGQWLAKTAMAGAVRFLSIESYVIIRQRAGNRMSEESVRDNRSWGPAIAKGAFLALTVTMFVGVVYILRSVLHAIILGALFAMLLMPLHDFFLRVVTRFFSWRYGRREGSAELSDERAVRKRDMRNRSIASALSVATVFVCVVVPLAMFGASVVHQGYAATESAQRWVVNELPGKIRGVIEKHHLQERIDRWSEQYRQFMSGELFAVPASSGESQEQPSSVDGNEGAVSSSPAKEVVAGKESSPSSSSKEAVVGKVGPEVARLMAKVMQVLRDTLLSLLSEAGIVAFNFCVMLFVMYQMFYDGRNMLAYLKSISPLRDEEQQRVAQRVREVSRAVFYGIFGTAVAQGVCASIFFKIAGIPVFWGVVLGLCSIVPVVGTSIIWIPVVVYLCLTGQYGWAAFIFVSCGCVVANFDMLLRPLLMKRSGETGMSYMVLFLSLLGGIQTFGLVGVIYGPMITGICSICLLIFSTQFKESSQARKSG